MRKKIVAVIVAFGGFAVVAAVPVTSAQAATGTAPQALCPAGATNIIYCAAFCPAGSSLESGLCVTAAGAVVQPQGPPTVYKWILWGTKLDFLRGPALKFKLLKGINGAPDLKAFKLILPKGLTFASGAFNIGVAFAARRLSTTATSLTAVLRAALPSLSLYFHNHSFLETEKLRHELASGKLKTLTFKLDVTDSAGLTTDLAFVVKPRS